MASYRVMDKEFTCSGRITAFRMCNVQHVLTNWGNEASATILGLILWSKVAGVQDRRILHGYNHSRIFWNQMVFKSGDQLEYIILDGSRATGNDELK